MTAHISKDPLHGVTLEMMVNARWRDMAGASWAIESKLTVSEMTQA